MSSYPILSPEQRERLLYPPSGHVSVVLDTDTYNEIDDQFALVYALLSPKLSLEAVYAAPFFNARSSGPADGMEKSYQEILRILHWLERDPEQFAFRGSKSYLPAPNTPVHSPAAEDLIAKAMAPREEPLYVLAIGAITNVASAILMAPEIITRIVVVWLGGHPSYWPHTQEFNLRQDIAAARVIFDSGVPLVWIPCMSVAEMLRTTLPEMERYVKGRGQIGDYLYRIFSEYHTDHFAYSKVIWDISAVGYVLHPEHMSTRLCPSPVLNDDLTWAPEDPARHPVRMVYHIDRDAIFGDLFRKLERHAASTT